jgi:hypothetical protein
MRAEDFDQATIEELQTRANKCFDLAQSPLEEPLMYSGVGLNQRPINLDDGGKLRLLLEAQFYVAAVARKRDEQVARRDYHLEVAVIVLICIEIILSTAGIWIGIHEANEQADVLSNIEKSSIKTATAMNAAATSLKTLADQQTASVSQLQQMNGNLQDSSTKTGVMAAASQKQLRILQDEQTSRLTQLSKKPKLEIYVGSIQLRPEMVLPANARQSTDDRSVYDIILKNSGDATATKGMLRVIVSGEGTWLECSSGANRVFEEPGSQVHSYLIQFEFLRPNVQIPMALTIGYPKGQQFAGMVNFNVDVEELPAGSPLGVLVVLPQQKPAN